MAVEPEHSLATLLIRPMHAIPTVVAPAVNTLGVVGGVDETVIGLVVAFAGKLEPRVQLGALRRRGDAVATGRGVPYGGPGRKVIDLRRARGAGLITTPTTSSVESSPAIAQTYSARHEECCDGRCTTAVREILNPLLIRG